MCLLKDIKINCQSYKTKSNKTESLYSKCKKQITEGLLCDNHKELYEIWCRAGGSITLLLNNIDATEKEDIEYFKDVLSESSIQIKDLDLREYEVRKEIHSIFQT